MGSSSYSTPTTKATPPTNQSLSRLDLLTFRRGIARGIPIFLGYVPVGLAFGLLAHQQGFTLLEALVCSATALAGAGQFIALSTMLGSGDAFTVIVATGVVNLRYVLFGATLSPYLRALKLRALTWIGYTLTDESFAINIADLRENKATLGSMNGVGFIAWIGWILGTFLGVTSSSWITNPSQWGVDFAMPAMFSALFVTLAENKKHVATGIISCGLVLLLAFAHHVGLGIDSNWFIVIAALGGATIATLVFNASDKNATPDATHELLSVAERNLLEEQSDGS